MAASKWKAWVERKASVGSIWSEQFLRRMWGRSTIKKAWARSVSEDAEISRRLGTRATRDKRSSSFCGTAMTCAYAPSIQCGDVRQMGNVFGCFVGKWQAQHMGKCDSERMLHMKWSKNMRADKHRLPEADHRASRR